MESQPTHLNTNSSTGYLSTCHLHTKHHQICHTSQQATYQHGHGSSSEDTQWHHHTFQHHQCNIYLHKLSADTPSHSLHFGESQDSLYYMRQIAMHAMDYISAATTSVLSPHVLPVEDLREMLMHIEVESPSTMHLPVSLDDTLHFYRYLHTHFLVVEEQFLLLIDIPIQDHAQQLKIYQVFNLFIPRGNLSAWYDIDTRYLEISQWNKRHRNFGPAIHHLPMSKWTVLQNWGTIPTTCQPTIVHYNYPCHKQGWNLSLMFSTDKE